MDTFTNESILTVANRRLSVEFDPVQGSRGIPENSGFSSVRAAYRIVWILEQVLAEKNHLMLFFFWVSLSTSSNMCFIFYFVFMQ